MANEIIQIPFQIPETTTQQDSLGRIVLTARIGLASGGRGADGKSAYELWLEVGNTGTLQDFLDSLASSAKPLFRGVSATGSGAFAKPEVPTLLEVQAVADSYNLEEGDFVVYETPKSVAGDTLFPVKFTWRVVLNELLLDAKPIPVYFDSLTTSDVSPGFRYKVDQEDGLFPSEYLVNSVGTPVQIYTNASLDYDAVNDAFTLLDDIGVPQPADKVLIQDASDSDTLKTAGFTEFGSFAAAGTVQVFEHGNGGFITHPQVGSWTQVLLNTGSDPSGLDLETVDEIPNTPVVKISLPYPQEEGLVIQLCRNGNIVPRILGSFILDGVTDTSVDMLTNGKNMWATSNATSNWVLTDYRVIAGPRGADGDPGIDGTLRVATRTTGQAPQLGGGPNIYPDAATVDVASIVDDDVFTLLVAPGESINVDGNNIAVPGGYTNVEPLHFAKVSGTIVRIGGNG